VTSPVSGLKNIWVEAQNNGSKPGFNVYLVDNKGHRSFVAWKRHSAPLFLLLRSGIRLESLRRMATEYQHSCKASIGQQISYLLKVIDVFLDDVYGDADVPGRAA